MSIFIRIWFFFGLIILLGLWFMSYTFNQQVKPNVRQVVEDTLAENANIIAMLVAEDVYENKVGTAQFDEKIQKALNRKLNANIWQHNKKEINQQIYITDAKGTVIYDSQGIATGQDYSRWNDVYLTLQGKYGVRSTRSYEGDPNSSTMFIAAPIYYQTAQNQQQKLIGVVSIGKPNSSVQPYIQRAEDQLLRQAAWITLLSLFLASLVAYWLKHSIDRVRKYAQALAPVNQTPYFRSAKELNQVAQAVENMREKLEDRAYVEHYVNTLTHELKSPLTAIQASAELLKEDLPLNDQQQFAQHIHAQSQRLKLLIDRMLLLTRLEKSKHQIELQNFNLSKLIQQVLDQQASQLQSKKIQCLLDIEANCMIHADRFWLQQTIANILDNALDFSAESSKILIQLHRQAHQSIQLQIFNEGEWIPEYALSQVFDTYFSLPRPITQQRSSGIGLSIVKQVIEQHHGQIQIQNIQENNIAIIQPHQQGVLVSIVLP
ncbi:MAG: two-component system sensor histidine kinase CreC [Acinetobacter sp.]|uniref:histidine kinase n=1 Tax=Acinetobacter johnsonii TaxID=40214 RepID=A0AAV3VKP4_ACIJO|nr:two-component system sensor histidine kinase CreC [Acinetobacter johnsonii]MDN5442319.1 two-component system sensor histidine kinase CreC [Acinetobacter sp.]MDN5443883.1 two-component system sensor histidine kinase CreC [Pseudomonadales bacterium]MDN5644678.1 two-component system sensor histidine kinase CreC [Acinetobacter sp.]MDN5690891.1 two-component system sensor histidine kinase CreC [Acinetobacter sp.]WQE01254.1 two-component system sensor histidine kinase CreC [Acinetobacter johnsoni